MLWLAGLLGIASVGAASLITFPTTEETEDGIPNVDDIMQQGHDLLDQLDSTDAEQEPDLFDLVAQDVHSENLTPADEQDDSPEHHVTEADYFAFDADGFDDETNEIHEMFMPAFPLEQTLVGDWVSSGPESEVFAYEAGSESLMLVWDDMAPAAAEPEVEVAPDPYDDEVMHVLMNKKSVAEIYGDPELTAADVTIIPLSSALIVGLQSA